MSRSATWLELALPLREQAGTAILVRGTLTLPGILRRKYPADGPVQGEGPDPMTSFRDCGGYVCLDYTTKDVDTWHNVDLSGLCGVDD
ncbi:MAG TPA: hypothetical protein VGO47_14455 [Chlamydiales bacterium]|jgi:hypothetical protein|nr:hypothetical protein [Chlamydiales bacterium]